MVGSAAVGAVIAHVAFWLLVARLAMEYGPRMPSVFVGLWLAGYFGLPLVGGSLFFMSYVAVLDVILVLIVLKGDIQVSR